MPGVVRPPWGAPTGPELADLSLVTAFIAGARTGHSKSFHIEEHTLLQDRLITVAIRCGPQAVLLRTDLDTPLLHRLTRRSGLRSQVSEPALATVVGLQSSGLPAATWDLWGHDLEAADRALRRAAAGEMR